MAKKYIYFLIGTIRTSKKKIWRNEEMFW
jgi:hypothetical protein